MSASKRNVKFFCDGLEDKAIEAWNAGNISKVMMFHPHKMRGAFVIKNRVLLLARGLYERALYEAFIHGPYMSPKEWMLLFSYANRNRLVEIGCAIPEREIVVYRGLSDSTKRQFVRGMSWTASRGIAAWFATRYPQMPNYAPAVYRAKVRPEQIFFATNERDEQELVVSAWNIRKVERLKVIPEPCQDAPIVYPFTAPAGGDEKEVIR